MTWWKKHRQTLLVQPEAYQQIESLNTITSAMKCLSRLLRIVYASKMEYVTSQEKI